MPDRGGIAKLPAAGLFVLAGLGAMVAAQPARPLPPQDKPLHELNPFLGDYEGTLTRPGAKAVPAFGKVGEQGGRYHVQLFAQLGKERPAKPLLTLKGRREGQALTFSEKKGGAQWSGRLADDKLAIGAEGPAGGRFEMKFVVRKSPTAGAKPPKGALVLLPYTPGRKSSLAAWKNQRWKLLDDGSVEVFRGTNSTKRSFSDFRMHLEFRVPYVPGRSGQGRGNSGVYILGRYEVQILDSFALEPRSQDCAALYKFREPSVNASLPPLSWQTYDITFRAARFEADGKTVKEYPRITVVHNGVTVHDDVELRHATGAARRRGHTPSGPINLQDHGNPVRFRNIWIVVKEKPRRAPSTSTAPSGGAHTGRTRP